MKRGGGPIRSKANVKVKVKAKARAMQAIEQNLETRYEVGPFTTITYYLLHPSILTI